MGIKENHTNEFKAKVVMAAMREDRTLDDFLSRGARRGVRGRDAGYFQQRSRVPVYQRRLYGRPETTGDQDQHGWPGEVF